MNYGKIKVFNLGTELDQASFYVDYAMSKRELAAAMEASRNSVIKWANIAWSCSSDFRKDTPQGEDGSYNRNAALTPYQVWLVSRIQLMMQRLKNSNRTKGYIKSNNDFFDKSRFEHLDHIVRKRWNEYYINAS